MASTSLRVCPGWCGRRRRWLAGNVEPLGGAFMELMGWEGKEGRRGEEVGGSSLRGAEGGRGKILGGKPEAG